MVEAAQSGCKGSPRRDGAATGPRHVALLTEVKARRVISLER
jgi:hypothetical protein